MTIIDTAVRRASVPHRCGYCLTCIPVGQAHTATKITDEGRIWTWRSCEHCEPLVDAVTRWLWSIGGNPRDEGLDDEAFLEWARDADGDPAAAAWQLRYTAALDTMSQEVTR